MNIFLNARRCRRWAADRERSRYPTLLGLTFAFTIFAGSMGAQTLPVAPPPLLPTTTGPATTPTTEPVVPATEPTPTHITPTTLPASVPSESPSTVPATTGSVLGGPPAVPANQMRDIVVTADLDRSREQIAPSLGAVSYTIGPNQIQNIPGGDNAPFQQVLLRAPGVVLDSFGQIHVRGEHANVLYRVNGVLLPEGISSVGGFGQELDTRLASSVTLITGSLPAQFGFHTSGIIDVTTKSGATLDHNEVGIYGGSYGTIEPSFLLGGTSGKLDYFVSGSYHYSELGVENTTPSVDAIHDVTSQSKLFTYLSYRLDDTSRVGLMLNASYGDFQIPNTPDQPVVVPLPGHPNPNSLDVNENQNQQDYYSVISYQKTLDQLSFLVAGFSRFGHIHFTPDPVNDLIFQGVAGDITNDFLTNGIQFDAAYILDDHNTVRFGLLADYTSEGVNTSTTVFPLDASGNAIPTDPFTIHDNRGNWGGEYGFYLQDEWKINKALTFNFGARYDIFDASFDHESQVSPRANLVWKIDDLTTAHAGYSRYFVPPPIQYTWPSTIAKFANTTNAPENFGDDPTRVERSNYYDVGIGRQLNPAWQVTLDGFYKGDKPLIDSGQFGSALILSPFNYEVGRQYGAEIGSTFKLGGLSLFGNFSWVDAEGREVITNQYLIDNAELAYIKDHLIKLDHEGAYTASAGASYAWKNDRVYVDVLYGSGLRSGFANTSKEPQYAPVSVGFEHVFHPSISGLKDIRFRFDIVNIFDEVYEIRNGTGIGVSASQFGQRRSFYSGLTFDF